MINASPSHQPRNDILTEEQVRAYQRDGFVKISRIISPAEAARFRQAALSLAQMQGAKGIGSTFDQYVNVWLNDPVMKDLTLHPDIWAAAQRLAGVKLRLWHDHILIKQPRKSTPTEFHQDQPYWPHADSRHPLSVWIALGDVPPQRGCMTFIPGSQHRTDLIAQNLCEERSLFDLCPRLEWEPRVTVPLQAGDCTFHHGRCAHAATSNVTDEARVAHVVIFMDATTTYTGKPHVVTDPLSLKIGDRLEGRVFPSVEEILADRSS